MLIIKRISQCFVTFVVLGMLLGNTRIGTAQSSSQVENRCGKQVTNINFQGQFWKQQSSIAGADRITTISVGDATTKTKTFSIDNKLSAYNYQVSTDGQALAFLTSSGGFIPYDLNVSVTLHIVIRNGTHLTLPGSPNWWQLGPELTPGHFGIITYDDKLFASILDVSWKGDTITATNIGQLPFQVPLHGSSWQKPFSISPNWEYLAYSEGLEFKVYSRNDGQGIFQMTYSAGIPRIMWIQDEKFVGVVNETMANGAFVAFDRKGNSQTIADLNQAFGSDVFVIGFTPEANSNDQIALRIQNKQVKDGKPVAVPKNQSYVLLNVDTGQFINLCYSSGDKAAGTLIWVENGDYLMVDETGKDPVVDSKAVLISTKTGDYTNLNQGQDVTHPIGWTNNLKYP